MKAVLKLCLSLLVMASGILIAGHSKADAAVIFSDIPAGHQAFNEITYLAQGKIVSGDISGKFNPKANVTRAEATAMIGRVLNLNGNKRKTVFKDVGSANFASGYIQSAVDKNIISGYSDRSFKPNGLVTRGEMAIMICKAFDYSFGNSSSGAAQAIKNRGIDSGVEDGTFGFNRTSDRATTAIFLARAINADLRTNHSVSFNKVKYVNTANLNVRTGPNTNYSISGKLNIQDRVATAYQAGSWTYIKSDSGITGFVLDSYLSVNPLPTTGGSADDTPNEDGTPSSPLSSQTIVIDPGHGGKDTGKIGLNKVKEKDINLDVALRLKAIALKTPFNIKLTRENDTFPELRDRVAFAKQAKANIFVSIHSNAGKGTGAETYYYSSSAYNPHVADSMALAKFIQDRLTVALDMKDRGIKNGDLHVIRENSMPAVLTELGFLDRKEDFDKLNNPDYRQKAAGAIYMGILDYYQKKGYNVDSLYSYASN
ncbi:N-acetylmuramoyl-L-alanine amidase [Bacillus testis]|uniref:N-acetylmuramoyl-L-alanine amidase n=1 Tax=Bacillus testis TaxID=1622072 RepID=UPI00067EF971|nr:N-acetylmuramoyl-L-alanine amidase [Bacillus testis]